MPQVSEKLIWVLTIGVLITIALVVGVVCGYPKYLMHKAEWDLASGKPKRMGPTFAYLLKRGDAGLKILEDFCRENTETGWGKEINGLRMRICTDSHLLKVESVWIEGRGNLKVMIQNVSDKEILFGTGSFYKTASLVRSFYIKQDGSREKLEIWCGGGITSEIILKSGEIYEQSHWTMDEGFNICSPGIYQLQLEFSGASASETVTDIATEKIISEKTYGAMIETIFSNRITFVVLPE